MPYVLRPSLLLTVGLQAEPCCICKICRSSRLAHETSARMLTFLCNHLEVWTPDLRRILLDVNTMAHCNI